ncbi:YecA family protein [Oleiharenicola lentus]|nr:SEC-C domain-containing protein [Oleiharenicola lentus]
MLEIADDGGFTPALRKNFKAYEVTTMADVPRNKVPPTERMPGRFEQRLPQILGTDHFRLKLIQTELERHTIDVSNLEELGKLVHAEFEYDLNNGNVRSLLGLKSLNTSSILPEDVFKVLRVLEVNSHLILTRRLKAAAVNIEAGCRSVLKTKIPPSLSSQGTLSSIEVFQDILLGKSIPDLGTLYLSKIITMRDVLEIRDGLDGIMFRQWIASSHYDKDIVQKKLLEPRIKAGFSEKAVRWIVPSALKISDSLGGSLLSKTASFLLNSFLDDWHPSVFLDQQLADKVDNKIAAHSAELERKRIIERFGKIPRNDPCPCGSGIKFKRCHGSSL